MDLEFIRDNYRRQSDQALLSIVAFDIYELTPHAIQALKEELKSRGLGTAIEKKIELLKEEISPEQINEYIEIIRNYPCPICNLTIQKINAAVIRDATYELVIGCPDCLIKEIERSNSRNMAFGLAEIAMGGGIMSIPLMVGGIRTASAGFTHGKMVAQIKNHEPTLLLFLFVYHRIGEIELYKNDEEKMLDLLRYPNAVL